MKSPFETAHEWDEVGAVPWTLHEKLGALGIFGFGIDEEYGGLGFDCPFMRCIVGEEMAKCGCVLKDIVLGKKGSSLGITEPGGGSDVANLKTTATRDGNHFFLNGSKTFITGGMTSDYFVIGARTGGPGITGMSLFFVEKDSPGFSRTPLSKKMGWWASDQATLYFDDCRVPATNLMGQEDYGFVSIMNNFNNERLVLTATRDLWEAPYKTPSHPP